MQLKSLGEFQLLSKMILPAFGKAAPLGDDCGWMDLGSSKVLLASIDSAVEDTHYRTQWFSGREIGVKALRSALGDIAAMGDCEWIACCLALGLRRTTLVKTCRQIIEGFRQESRRWRVRVIGGDIVETQGKEFLTTTVMALAGKDKLMKRSQAEPGETLWLTGPVGLAKAGFEALRQGLAHRYGFLVDRQKCPHVALTEGARLSARGLSRCAMDLSDSLAQACLWVAKLSHIDLEIDLRRMPVAPALNDWARLQRRALEDYLLCGAEDYELLFTSSASANVVSRFLKAAYPIGRVLKGNGKVVVCGLSGKRRILQKDSIGYQAFSR